MKQWFVIGLAAGMLWLLGSACSPEFRQYTQWSRKGSIAEKDSAAFYFYKRGDYEKASLLFEDLRVAYRGTARARDVLYHYAYAKYHFGLYIVASYYFEEYARLYPNDVRTPECSFMLAYCDYLESAPYYLDQTFTNKSINQLQVFINSYPDHEKAKEANDLINTLRERLAQKEFETANLYYKIGNFKAAVTSFDVMIQEYPDSRYREEAQYLLFKSAAALAEISIADRKKNRYLDALEFYERFVDKYPSSAFLKDAENTYIRTKRNLGKLLAGENS
ncbi:MAG: hypothetical protein OHK0039_25170 [Bacteroidia bacterium]